MEKLINIGKATYNLTSDDDYLESQGTAFEPAMVDLLTALIEPDDVVADIGANIGLTAILFSGIARQVLAFEPSVTTFAILNENVARSERRNISTVNCGLGDKAETLVITFGQNNRSGGFVGTKTRVSDGHVTESVEIDTLDHFCLKHEFKPTFLKIDVEGFEPNVIAGGIKVLNAQKPTVVMEMNHFCLGVLQRVTVPDFLDFMRSVFPYLYAIEGDNTSIMDLHDGNEAYIVMHEHVVNNRFLNIVGGYSPSIRGKLFSLKERAFLLQPRLPGKTPTITDFSGSILPNSTEISAAPNELITIPIMLNNLGSDAWHDYGNNPVKLSYHWQNTDGTSVIYDGIRTDIQNSSIASGCSFEQAMHVRAPTEIGSFILTLTVVQEFVCWFEDRGFDCWRGTVTVA